MRLIAALCTLLALAAAAQAGHLLWRQVSSPASAAPAQAAFAPGTGAAEPQPVQPGRRWPPLFGERQPPRPQAAAPVQAEPQPPQAPQPPLASLGYALKGVVQAGGTAWAMVAHPAGARLVRAGDALSDGITAERIGPEGLWVSRGGGAPELLGFPDQP